MTGISPLDALEALHRELIAVCEHRFENLHVLELELDANAQAFRSLLDKPARNDKSRNAIQAGKILVDDEDYSLNAAFQQDAIQLADEIDLDEIEAAKILIDCQDCPRTFGRTLFENGLVRYHQQRRYLLDCIRLCLQLADDDELDHNLREHFSTYVDQNIYVVATNGSTQIISRCMEAMQEVKAWLQKIADRMTAAGVFHGNDRPPIDEVLEYSRISLLQQNELLALITARAVNKRHATAEDFRSLLTMLQRLDRYDQLLVHLFPVIGTYIAVFGSTEGNGDLNQARQFYQMISKDDDETWTLPNLHAAIRAWWVAEYSGLFVEIVDGVDTAEDEKNRLKQFTEALKDGAFDFILAVVADVKTPDWHDPTRLGTRQWLQRKSPSLVDAAPFSEEFQLFLVMRLQMLVEGLVANMPDVLRKMRNEEDEQRQLNNNREQDLDLERFLLIIAYAYEGRPDAAADFWEDSDSNLAGFLQWASRRASTPLVSAFCEMLQSISANDLCAKGAHEFLLDDGQMSSGKLRKTQSLTWTQIFKELGYFTNKLQKPATLQSHLYRAGKLTLEQAEAEPESVMMLECYLRLITKLASQSETVRVYLLKSEHNTVIALFQLVNIPGLQHTRLRSSAFYALRALMSRKTQDECAIMWRLLDEWATGQLPAAQIQMRQPLTAANQTPATTMRKQLTELAKDFEEPNAIVQFLNSLVTPVVGSSSLKDALPFPEELGSQIRMPGIDPYVDYVLGSVFGHTSGQLQDISQTRTLRLSCLEFVLLCLDNFNENLIILAHEAGIPVDSLIATADLATYVKLHPFARVMEWLLTSRVMKVLFATINPKHNVEMALIAAATPDSPIMLSVLRAVEVTTRALDLHDTYTELVRPLIKDQPNRKPVAGLQLSVEDGVMSHITLVVNLGRYCGMGHPDLTLACLKLLERISSSTRIASAWSPGQLGQTHRNKAIVALEQMGDAEDIAGSFIADMTQPLDLSRKAESPNYLIKAYILDFIYSCLQSTPNQPTIAHQLLGFDCGIDFISIKNDGTFQAGTSLLHHMLRTVFEIPFGDEEMGMWRWTIDLKFKIMRIFQALWASPLTSSVILAELREHDFIFHLLIREMTIQPQLPWDGQLLESPDLLLSDSSNTFILFLALRAITLEYASIELCSISQQRQPHLKRRLLDALNGQLKDDDGELQQVPGIFSLFDFLPADDYMLDVPPPSFDFYRDLNLGLCLQDDSDGNTGYNLERVREVLLLKRRELGRIGQLATEQQLNAMDREETVLLEYLEFSNRRKQLASFRHRALKSWVNILLVVLESNEFQGSDRTSFHLQTLQVILPSLECYASEHKDEALQLAKVAKILLFKIDFSETGETNRVAGELVGDKLFQLFQICLSAMSRWAEHSELRAVYYNICYRYLAGIVGERTVSSRSRHQAMRSVHIHGEKLLNMICDDAERSDVVCQSAALILLECLVRVSIIEGDPHVVETLNRLNFIGVLVEDLKSVFKDWLEAVQAEIVDIELLWSVRLALLLTLSQTRDGAKYVIQNNLFRALELSGLFSADPDLDLLTPTCTRILERHYSLLLRVTRVVGAAVLARGPQSSITQGPARRFLTQHRALIMQVLKKSAGIRSGVQSRGDAAEKALQVQLEQNVGNLAEVFMLLITATGFLEFEDEILSASGTAQPAVGPGLFH